MVIRHPLIVALRQVWDHFKPQFALLQNETVVHTVTNVHRYLGGLGSVPSPGTGHLISLGKILPFSFESRDSGS